MVLESLLNGIRSGFGRSEAPKQKSKESLDTTLVQALKPFVVSDEMKQHPLSCACCVDGRDEKAKNTPTAFPGGSYGFLAVMYAALNTLKQDAEASKVFAGVDDKKVWEILKRASGGIKNIGHHGDDHSEHDPAAGRGCGHIKLMQNDPAAYGLTPEQAKMFEPLRKEADAAGVEMNVLRGDHKEETAIVIDDEGASRGDQVYSLEHSAPNGRMAFIYHRLLSGWAFDDFSDAIAETLGVKDAEMWAEKLAKECKVIADRHVLHTVGVLTKGQMTPTSVTSKRLAELA